MSKILTDEERAELLQRELDESLAREKEKAKVTGFILQIRYEKLKLRKELEFRKALLSAIIKPLSAKEKKEFPEILAQMAYFAELGEICRAKKNSYFAPDLSKPENEELAQDLNAVDMTEDQFATLAMCACGNDMEKFVEKFGEEAEDEIREKAGIDSSKRKKNIADYDKIRDSGILKAKAAISELRNGDPKSYALILGNALKLSCAGFAREVSDDVAMQWSMYTNEIIHQFRARPTLIKHCGLGKKFFELAEKVAEMGKTINGGLKAAEGLSAVEFSDDGTIKHPEKIEEMSCSVLKFQAVTRNRESLLDEMLRIDNEIKPVQTECILR